MFDFLFSVSLLNLVEWIIPPFLRKNRLKGLLIAFKAGFEVLKTDLLNKRSDVKYFLQFTGQRIYLERFLNDKFDPFNRGIIIENASFITPKYVYNAAEQRQRFRYNQSEAVEVYKYNRSEVSGTVHYYIKVPAYIALTDLLKLQISQETDKLNLATKIYQIITY